MADNRIRARAKAIFPTVLLTLLSIVQALALELMWTHVTEQSYLYVWSFVAFVSWIQISATFLGILLIWLIYSDLVLRLSWVPSTTDAVFPFLVGILEFAQVGMLGPNKIGLWLVILGVLFASMAWISHTSMRRARYDSDNADFFDGVSPAEWRDHLTTAIPVMVLIISGAWIWFTANQGVLAVVALVLVNSLLAYQIRLNHLFTQRSYAMD